MTKPETIGQRIRRLRLMHAMKQSDLADALGRGTSHSLISQWESGYCHPRINEIPHVAITLGVTSDYLLTGRESPLVVVTLALREAA